jgi:DNA-binding response OmpR family regulator
MAKILIGVADARILTYLAEGLAIDGHEIHRAGSIDAVIDKLAEERFDIFVADIFQPLIEGVALFATVARASPPTRSIALMDFQSARARNYDLSLWVDSVLMKPFTESRVRNEVAFILANAARRPVPELV